MSNPLRAVISAGIRPKPAAPASSQVIACPAGYTGSGQHQSRTVGWNVPSQTWITGDWVTDNFDCVEEAMTFVGPIDCTYVWDFNSSGFSTVTYDHTVTQHGHTVRMKMVYTWGAGTIEYEVWAPTLAGKLARPHWTDGPPGYKGPESNWQPFAALDGSGYLKVPPRQEEEYGIPGAPFNNIKRGECNSCNVDIK